VGVKTADTPSDASPPAPQIPDRELAVVHDPVFAGFVMSTAKMTPL
jgi:hypothetical protein